MTPGSRRQCTNNTPHTHEVGRMEPEMTKAVINLTLTAAVSPELREANRKAVMESVRPTMDDIRYRQWQQAMWRVKVMRDELVRLGVTDPAILGSPVMFFNRGESRDRASRVIRWRELHRHRRPPAGRAARRSRLTARARSGLFIPFSEALPCLALSFESTAGLIGTRAFASPTGPCSSPLLMCGRSSARPCRSAAPSTWPWAARRTAVNTRATRHARRAETPSG